MRQRRVPATHLIRCLTIDPEADDHDDEDDDHDDEFDDEDAYEEDRTYASRLAIGFAAMKGFTCNF